MFDFLFVSTVILLWYFSSLILNLKLVPAAPSEYELKRKARDGDSYAKKQAWLKKHAVEVNVSTLLLFLTTQSLFILMVSKRLGKVWPALILSLLGYVAIRFAVVKKLVPKMFSFWEHVMANKMQDLVGYLRPIIKPLLGKQDGDTEKLKSYYSEEEFAYRFAMDGEVLSDATRTKIDRIIKGSKTRAKDIMLEIKAVPKVDVNLSLTPVIYNELHQKGYDMALVFQGAGDNLVGLLYLSGSEAVAQLNTPTSVRVGDKMEQGLQYVTEDVKLDDLVAGFLQGGQNAVLVTGPGGRVSGVITARKLLAWVSGV